MQEGLEKDERWKIIVRKNNWLCPYCGKIGARELKMDEAIEAKIADHFATTCDRWKDFEAEPLTIDRLRLRAKLLVFKARVARWVQDDRRFRLADDERRWLCPYCAEETAVQAPEGDLDDPSTLGPAAEDDPFIDAAARHLLECAEFARGEERVRPLRDLEERRARLSRRGREDRLRERFEREPEFRIADGDRRWLCPFCALPTDARLRDEGQEPDAAFFEAAERHLLLCKAYQVLEGRPRPVEELRQKLQKDVRSSRLVKVREKIRKHAIWRARDAEGWWYCPYCAVTSDVRFPPDRSDEDKLDRFVERVIEHLGACAAYKEPGAQIKSKAHMADVIARANASSSLRTVFRTKLVEDRLFAVTDEVDNWACPYCKKVQKAIHIYPMTETAVFDKTVEQVVQHLEEECEGYTPDAPPRCTRDELERIARPGTSLRSSGITDARVLQKPLGQLSHRAEDSREATAGEGWRSVPQGAQRPLGQSGEYYARLKKDLDEVKSRMEIVGRRAQSLKEARSKQLRLLPAIPTLPDYEFGCVYRPCDDVGGDFYDFIKIDDGKIGLAIGDIAGHGIEAALLMGLAKKLLEVHGRRCESAAEALCLANQDIFPDLDERTFVTVFYGILDTSTRVLRFSRAGHNPLVLYNPSRRPALQVHDSKGMALGMDSGPIFRESIEELELELKPGDLLFQYTDGVSEAMNAKGEEFGLERVTRVIEEWGQNEAEYVLWKIEKAVDAWLDGAPPKDDITMFAVRVLA